jgi:glyoxylase-like metal-dependent hydrolase (beta-lactamase superfamily II)
MAELKHSRKKIAEGITLFHGIENEGNIYLVEGISAALVIDAGFGITDLNSEIRAVTALPFSVVNTHGHGDHSGGDIYFSEVHLHAGAVADAEAGLELNKTVLSAEQMARLTEAALNSRSIKHPVVEGACFELGGGRTLEVIETPGHTPGCISLFDKLSGIVFTGDCLVKTMDILLVVPTALSVAVYLSSMEKLLGFSGEFTSFCTGHDEEPLPVSFLRDTIECARQIVAGVGKSIEVELPAVFGDTKACRAEYGDAAILYRPSKVLE